MNDLPTELFALIESELARFPTHTVKKAREELTRRYRGGALPASPFISSEAERIAYIAARMPATYAVCREVFDEIGKRGAREEFQSLLDLGSGPGTAAFAAFASFPQLSEAALFERDGSLIELGKRLSHPLKVGKINWIRGNLLDSVDFPERDLVVLSYSFGELPQNRQGALIDSCFRAAKKAVVVIEPGTPKGYANILRARERLIACGAHLIAPCPHRGDCPLQGVGWCHFSKRVQRSKFHKLIKEGELGYEDEKYSYIAASKFPLEPCPARILGAPKKHGGHTDFFLCTKEGLREVSLSKRSGASYKATRKLSWGDAFPDIL